MKDVAVGDHIVIRPIKSTTTPGGIVLPDGAKTQVPGKGTVVSVGGGVEDDIYEHIDPDDTVLFDPYGAFDLGDGLVAVKGENIIFVYGPAHQLAASAA